MCPDLLAIAKLTFRFGALVNYLLLLELQVLLCLFSHLNYFVRYVPVTFLKVHYLLLKLIIFVADLLDFFRLVVLSRLVSRGLGDVILPDLEL